MIIIKLNGGLGNQMFQYAAGYAFAKESSKKLSLDTSWFATQDLRKYELNEFEIVNKIAKKEELPFGIHSSGWKRNFFKIYKCFSCLYLWKRKKIYIDEPRVDKYKNILAKYSEIYLDGYWQSEKYFEKYSSNLQKIFNLPYDLRKKYPVFFKIIDNENAVSVHIRRGDYVSNKNTNAFHGTCAISYYKNAIEEIKQKVEKPYFIFFSDDLEWVKHKLKIENDTYFVENTTIAHEDILLMSKCKHHIIANSSFSWWGAYLNTNNKKLVIAPKIWFRNENKNKETLELVPSNWIRI